MKGNTNLILYKLSLSMLRFTIMQIQINDCFDYS